MSYTCINKHTKKMKKLTKKSVSFRSLENGIFNSKNFENKVISHFADEINYNLEWYSQFDFKLKSIMLHDVSLGNVGRFNRKGYSATLKITVDMPCDITEGDRMEYEFEIYLSSAIEAYEWDSMRDKEYGTVAYSNMLKGIVLDLLRTQCDNPFERVIDKLSGM